MNLSKDKKLLRNDLALIAFIVCIAVLIILIADNKAKSSYAIINYSDGSKEAVFLSEDRTIEVDTELGRNVISIHDNSICICEADCKDELCVKQGEICRAGESVVCLPHKISILIVDGEESNLDSMTY